MRFIGKIKGLFTCDKRYSTVTLNNRLVQEDLYFFFNSERKDFAMVFTTNEFQIARRVGDGEVIYYPYETKEQMEEDYLELRRVIKK